jgi:LysM repeat protein
MDLVEYTVREGNTLFAIAQFFQTTVDDILQYNNIQNPSLIYTGEVLTIPAGSNSADYHVTRPGDTLWSIAQMHNTTISQLSKLNGLNNPNVIYPGQIIKIK